MTDPFNIQVNDTSSSERNLSNVKSEFIKNGASPELLHLLDGLNEPGDCGNSTNIPPWLDINLFHKGRKLYKKWLASLYFSNLLSLVISYNLPRSLRVLIFTKNSDTPLKAYNRFLSTIKHLMAWESGNIWDSNDKAHRDLQSIRKIHKIVSTKVNSDQHYTDVNEARITNIDHSGSACPMSSIIREEFQQKECKFIALENEDTPPLYISQFDMIFTQWAFIGLMVTHPKKMGCHYGTEEEFDAIIHFWRAIGYLLGIDDKYNICKGSLEEVRNLFQEFEQSILVPHLSLVDKNYEVMARAYVDGVGMMLQGPVIGMSFPSIFLYAADVLGEEVPIFARHMTLMQKIQYWHLHFFFNYVFLIPGADIFFSTGLRSALERLIKENTPTTRKHSIWFKIISLISIKLSISYIVTKGIF